MGIGPIGSSYADPMRNDLLDVAGLRLGHYQRTEDGYLTGTTVLLAPDGGMTAGVDVRGGAPGTRETDLLHPTASVQKIHALVLTGGSAFGLSAACGVMSALEDMGVGFPAGPTGTAVVPIVPGAVLFDLGRGGALRARPDDEFGVQAVRAAIAGTNSAVQGVVGAGTGAVSCGIKGGLGMASTRLPSGGTVSALVVANAAGSPVDRRTGGLLGAHLLEPGDGSVRAPGEADRERVLAVIRSRDPRLIAAAPPDTPVVTNTTIGIIATDLTLTKTQCTKLAAVGHDGLARALNPVHTAFDGDTLFAVATGGRPAPDELDLHELQVAAANTVTRALVRGLLAARSVHTPAGAIAGYGELAPSAVAV